MSQEPPPPPPEAALLLPPIATPQAASFPAYGVCRLGFLVSPGTRASCLAD